MEFYYRAPVWDSNQCPTTSKLAKPIKWEAVDRITAVRVVNATYRSAVFSGVFALDEREAIKTGKQGWNEGVFYCLWFDHRLKSRGILIKFDPITSEVLRGYSGEVVSGLGR
jgi:hypothetical protein